MNKCYIIAGMHRSGTSLTSNLCYNMGVYLGEDADIVGPDGANEAGYFENRKFMDMNEKILELAGGTWYDPPSDIEIDKIIPSIKNEIKELIKIHERQKWGIKDPRLLFTLPAYEKYLKNIHLIIITRNKHDVLKSFYRTHVQAIQKSARTTDMIHKLYDRINDKIEFYKSIYPHVILKYEELFNNPDIELRKLADFIEYTGDIEHIKDTIQVKLRHFKKDKSKKTLWIIGNSRAGKSMFAQYLLNIFNTGSVIHLDGDMMRSIWTDLAYSKDDRIEQNIRIARLAKELNNQGFIVVVSSICPFEESRQKIQEIIDCDFIYLEGGQENSEKYPFEKPTNNIYTIKKHE